jgi:antitoxin (DNA-binding transcriptional repressor) of toxin-antitoxin stability system
VTRVQADALEARSPPPRGHHGRRRPQAAHRLPGARTATRVLYNVRVKRYSMAQARQQFAELLDAAERGHPVVIERRGVRFVMEARRRPRPRPVRRRSIIQRMDPAVASGEWTWSWNARSLRFKGRPRAR